MFVFGYELVFVVDVIVVGDALECDDLGVDFHYGVQ